MTVKFNVKNVGPPAVKRMVRSKGAVKIPANFNSIIPFEFRDFIFVFKKIYQLGNNGDVFSYIVDVYTAMVQVININTENVYSLKNNKLNTVQNYEKKVVISEIVFFNSQFR